MSDTGIAKRWRVLSGSDNWEGLLEPLDSDLRRYLIHYGTMVSPATDSFINEPASKNVGLSRYARRNLLANCGLVKGNPFKYEVTKYFYAPSIIPIPDEGYNVRPTRADAVLKESNWNGYVAVATDEGKVALGRRDILIVWRGTIRKSEWNENITFWFVKAPLFFGQNSDPLVHKGWYDMYTTINQDSQLNKKSARDQISEEVARLVELYKDEEISITVTGHSLGSSLATLNAVDMAFNPFRPDIPVTAFLYASPKVGDENFKNAISNQQNLRALRITDVNDLVPIIPPFGWKEGDNIITTPPTPYGDVGVGLVIDSKKSDYLKPDVPTLSTHDLMLYMHGIDGYQGSQGGFERHGDFDLAKVNRYGDYLKAEYPIPIGWFNIKDKGMVQQDNGNYILDDHEVDETF
ncbi:PREDICTED: phospholipase A1-II 1-like [Ipomoea nil]|uniref:phospholipase A1-II 1-like n=1 Tax=Ipomoea nil TaxID=35883 RepID=UPI000900EF00|nr:PREDICTED: phospholipase A1-II 1-like [Ipomoea nil]